MKIGLLDFIFCFDLDAADMVLCKVTIIRPVVELVDPKNRN
jgi:hypothetical protein